MFEHYLKSGKEALEYLSKYREVAKRVKEVVKTDYKDAKVYVFGSTIKGRFTAASDIDILIVCDEIDRDKAEHLKVKVLRALGYSVPLQIHVATTRELKEWYLKFVEEIEEV
jgi:predicted nucleotidyltransferase